MLADQSAVEGAILERTPTTEKLAISKTWGAPTLLKRIETALRSLWILRNLTPGQVDSFMKSYVIYELDWKDEVSMIKVLGPNYQQKVGECLRDYYSVLNHLCAVGELEKMYVPPILDLSQGISANQVLYEETIAEELRLPSNAKVLDLGCGRGRVAAHMTSMTGANVTGLNIDADQVASAIVFNKDKNYDNEFIRADFNDLPLPFPDAYFDGFYQIQAFSLCKDIPKLCKELSRVLKPGARLSLLDWVSLPNYQANNPHHLELMRAIKPLIGAVGTPTPESMAKDLESAGLRVLDHGNPSVDGLQAPLIERAEAYFGSVRFVLLSLVRLGVLPEHFKTLFDRMTKDGAAFIEADRSRLITTCYHWLAEKPLLDSMHPAAESETESPGGSDWAVASGTDTPLTSNSPDSSSASLTSTSPVIPDMKAEPDGQTASGTASPIHG